ncbi:MAG: diaminopimelate epimerase [Chitinophagaceae bacterium]
MIPFSKYQGTGNDFVLIDNRDLHISLTAEQIAFMCHRRFGIGADGLMLLEKAAGFDFRMVYFNSDGNESTMCGNGGRCITAFARDLGIITGHAHFIAIDGAHEATVLSDGDIALHMNNVQNVQHFADHAILNTGSPHYVEWVEDVAAVNVFERGKHIRYDAAFAPGGTNVNFVQRDGTMLKVRTYERGVEDETYSCGTGVTAAAIAASGNATGAFSTDIATPGGKLNVSFIKDSAASATGVVLTGPARHVFAGHISLG